MYVVWVCVCVCECMYVYFICDACKHITSRKRRDSFSHKRPQIACSNFFVLREMTGKLGLQTGPPTKLIHKNEE